MGFWLSKQKNEPDNGVTITVHDRAVMDMKHTRDMLTKQRRAGDAIVARETEVIRALVGQGKRKRAALALKRRKLREAQLEKVEQQLANVQQLIDSVEFAQEELNVFESLKLGRDTLQGLTDQMKIEDVERLMDDTADAVAHVQEIDELLSGALTPEDEFDVEAELAQLIEESALEAAHSMPDAPQQPLAGAESEPTAVESKQSAPKERKQAQLAS